MNKTIKLRLTTFFYLLISYHTAWSHSPLKDSTLVSRFRPGIMWFYTGLRPASPGKAQKYDRLIMDLTYNTWTGDQPTFSTHANSIGLNTSLLADIPLSKKNNVSLGVGISHSLFKIDHNNDYVFSTSSNQTSYTHKSELDYFDKCQLLGNSLSVPVEIRFRAPHWRHVKFHLGVKVGYQLNIYSKTVRNGENGKRIIYDYNFGDINRFIYSLHARIGVRNWALFASYQFNSLFSNASSTKLNLVQFGLSLSLF
jgi:hypothetical protein